MYATLEYEIYFNIIVHLFTSQAYILCFIVVCLRMLWLLNMNKI